MLSPAVLWVALRTGGTGLLGAMVATGTVSVIALARESRRPVSRRRGVWQALTPMVVVVAVWDSATLIADCRAPSDLVMTARRVRSADSWRFMASWTSRGGLISRISTVVTLPPQRSVTSSSFTRRTSLICSRFERTSSSRMSPITARSVVVATPWSAPAK